MKKVNFNEALSQILKDDPRFSEQAYLFLRHALDFTIKLFAKPIGGPSRHVTGSELLDGIRQYALREYGAMAKTVLNYWGVHKCEDFGVMVFNLVEKGIFGKTDQDRKEDFNGGYDFDDAFRQPFKPGKKVRASTSKKAESA
jgi:uncharacterized repeat protein (TIGR04138 family)